MDEIIRRATIHDAEAVSALTRLAYAPWVPLIGREPLPMKTDYAIAILEHRVDLMHVGSELAAVIEMVEREDELLIENVAVAPRYQKRGYGRRLLSHAEQLAVEACLTVVRLYTNSRFEVNLRLYASLGYKIEREEARNGGVAIHMLKRV